VFAGGRLRPLFVFPILCVLASAISLRLRAQTTSVIEGTVVDSQGLAIADVEVMASGSNRAGTVKLATDQTGSYRLPGLQPGNYSLRFTKPGFGTKLYERLPVTVNRVLTFDVALPVSEAREEIRVSATPPLIDATVSSSGGTITSRQIEDMPINGRNYLDLMQLVPGVAVNRQANAGTDAATPIFGERGGNAIFLIDGMPNSNQELDSRIPSADGRLQNGVRTWIGRSCERSEQERRRTMARAGLRLPSQQRARLLQCVR